MPIKDGFEASDSIRNYCRRNNILQPMIVAEMEAKIPSLSVGEAVMQMELAGAPVLVFRNESKNGVNVVYRREDGNIGWIDPQQV